MPCSCAGGLGLSSPMGGGIGMVPIWGGNCSGQGGGTCGGAVCASVVGNNLPTQEGPCFYAPANVDIQAGQGQITCASTMG